MSRTFLIAFVVLIIVVETINGETEELESARGRLFEVDYEHDQFLKDGQPFQYVAGSLHYFRVPRQYWQDRLRKLRAAGLNTVSTYIEWSFHEPRKGHYDFSGDKDIEHFIKLAEEEGLLVILRPGPYICAERDLGGYPVWLLHENPKMYLRTNDSSHTKHVHKWLNVILPKIQPLLYGNGGPVIMVQIENEYGSYVVCDRRYQTWLRDVFRSYVGDKAVLFTTDGFSSGFLRCGPIPGVFITVDFSAGMNMTTSFKALRQIQPHGPLVNSEFYPGWLTHWGEDKSTVNTSVIVNTTEDLLAINASFNFFMFFGGTNFGFTSGANAPPFEPQITSYDYDAPISEAGDLTDKYFAIKSVISKFLPVPTISVQNSTKMSYGRLVLDAKISLFDSNKGNFNTTSVYPQTFEALQLYSGFMLYETTLPSSLIGPGYLEAPETHDRAIVYINKSPVGIFSRSESKYAMEIGSNGGETLSLLVENQGHINFRSMFDLKGLTKNVTVGGQILTNWKHIGYSLDDVSDIVDLPNVNDVTTPAFYSTRFQLPESLDMPLDTFVDMTGWVKGSLYVNGHNLGRYWPERGPQITLYLPAPYLYKYPEYNTVVVLELERPHPSRSIQFVTDHIWKT